jgi:hypothetical protein
MDTVKKDTYRDYQKRRVIFQKDDELPEVKQGVKTVVRRTLTFKDYLLSAVHLFPALFLPVCAGVRHSTGNR